MLHEKIFEEIIDNPWNQDILTINSNPLGKIPILILTKDEPLFDSKVIIQYLFSNLIVLKKIFLHG